MKIVESFEYILQSKKLELYDGQGDLVVSFNPIKIIKEHIEPSACYLISNGDDFTIYNKHGQDVANVPVWECVNIWQDTKLVENLSKKYLES